MDSGQLQFGVILGGEVFVYCVPVVSITR
jgi:hypothetical protein